jgi:zinc/manganese transport system substrate-binding protein
MKRLFAFACLLASISSGASAALRIVTTTPDLADLTRQVGGELVSVESLAKGTEDIHAVPQKPSFVPKLNRADAVVCVGLELEHSFLPALLAVAQNPKVLAGKPGHIDVSRHVAVKEAPQDLSRAYGELHPLGNPHFNIDPRNGAAMVRAIVEGLSRIDAANAETYRKNGDAYTAELQKRIRGWQALAANVQGKKAISQHRDMVYLAEFLGLALVGEIEPKPGIEPTPRHLERLVDQIRSEKIELILREFQYSPKPAEFLAERTGAKIAVVATMGGAFADSKTYIGMIEHNVQAIVQAAGK